MTTIKPSQAARSDSDQQSLLAYTYPADILKSEGLLGFLHRIFKDAGRGCLPQLFKSVVLPHLDYCCSV